MDLQCSTQLTQKMPPKGDTVIINQFNQKIGWQAEKIQATAVNFKIRNCNTIVAAVYCPPKYNIKVELHKEFLNYIGNRFVIGGDFNAKHMKQ